MWTQQPRCDRSWGRLMISSIIRLPSPGQTPLVGEDSSERLWVCLCCACLYVHLKMRKCRHTLHRYKTNHHSFHNAIFVLGQHSQGGSRSCLDMWQRSCCVTAVINLFFFLEIKGWRHLPRVTADKNNSVVINKYLLNHNISSISVQFTLQASLDTSS